jgi:ankyrin repeat protein
MPTTPPKSSTSSSTKVLCAAVKNNDLPAAKVALEAGADPSFYYSWGDSLLMIAAAHANVELFCMLMNAGADPTSRAGRGGNALTYALQQLNGVNKAFSRKDCHKMVKLLLELSSPSQRISIFDEAPGSILHYAVNCGHDEKVCELLIRSGVPIDIVDPHGQTILHLLAQDYNRPELLSFFIKSGAPLNARLAHNNFTPPHSAIVAGNYKAIEQLLSAGANPNLPDIDGHTLLHWCADGGHHDIISLVLAHGADHNLKDNIGRTAEEVALAEGRLEAHEMLRRHRELETLKQAVSGTYAAPRGRI